MLSSIAARRAATQSSSLVFRRCRYFSDVAAPSPLPIRPIRKTVTKEERTALRAARKERAAKLLEQQGTVAADGSATTAASGGATSSSGSIALSSKYSRYMWYASFTVPTALLVWGFNDKNSPPAKFADMIGLTNFISSFTEDFAKPSHDKLLPDWSQVSFFNKLHLVCTVGSDETFRSTCFCFPHNYACFWNDFF